MSELHQLFYYDILAFFRDLETIAPSEVCIAYFPNVAKPESSVCK